jgi:hypothetical protein
MPHETARKRIVVYLTEEKHTELKTFCAKLRISMSWFVDLAIRDKVRKEIELLKERK